MSCAIASRASTHGRPRPSGLLVLFVICLRILLAARGAAAQETLWEPEAAYCEECGGQVEDGECDACCSDCDSCCDEEVCCEDQACCAPPAQGCCHLFDDGAPMGGWLGLYVRAGVAIPVSHQTFDTKLDAGASVQFGVRQRLSQNPYEFMFFDLGGSFLSAQGLHTAVTGATFKNNVTNIPTFVSNAFNTTLLNVRRSAFDIALGSYFNPLAYLGKPPGLMRGFVRAGGRFGTMYGRFHDVTLPDLANALLNARQNAILTGATISTATGFYNKTSSDVGLFIATGVDYIITNPNPACSPRPFITVGADVEYSHDWFNFTRFGRLQLDAISIMAHSTLIF